MESRKPKRAGTPLDIEWQHYSIVCFWDSLWQCRILHMGDMILNDGACIWMHCITVYTSIYYIYLNVWIIYICMCMGRLQCFSLLNHAVTGVFSRCPQCLEQFVYAMILMHISSNLKLMELVWLYCFKKCLKFKGMFLCSPALVSQFEAMFCGKPVVF